MKEKENIFSHIFRGHVISAAVVVVVVVVVVVIERYSCM